MDKAKILRKQLFDRDLVRIVGAHDGLGSKLIAKSGFEGVPLKYLLVFLKTGMLRFLTQISWFLHPSGQNPTKQGFSELYKGFPRRCLILRQTISLMIL